MKNQTVNTLRQFLTSALPTEDNILLLAHLGKHSFIKIRIWPLLKSFTATTYSVLSPTKKI